MNTIVAARGCTFAKRRAAADRLITVRTQTSDRPQRCSSIPVTVVDTRRVTLKSKLPFPARLTALDQPTVLTC